MVGFPITGHNQFGRSYKEAVMGLSDQGVGKKVWARKMDTQGLKSFALETRPVQAEAIATTQSHDLQALSQDSLGVLANGQGVGYS